MERLNLCSAVDACLCCLDGVNYVTEPEALQTAFERVHVPQSGRPVRIRHQTPEKFARIDGGYNREDDGVFCVWQAAVEDGLCAYQFDIFSRRTMCVTMRDARAHAGLHSLTAMLEQAVLPRSKPMATSPLRPYRAARTTTLYSTKEINVGRAHVAPPRSPVTRASDLCSQHDRAGRACTRNPQYTTPLATAASDERDTALPSWGSRLKGRGRLRDRADQGQRPARRDRLRR